jgi:hypothetical protein
MEMKYYFKGDVEEMIAEPINQGQFAPLSDSLCWIIQELTGAGMYRRFSLMTWPLKLNV